MKVVLTKVRWLHCNDSCFNPSLYVIVERDYVQYGRMVTWKRERRFLAWKSDVVDVDCTLGKTFDYKTPINSDVILNRLRLIMWGSLKNKPKPLWGRSSKDSYLWLVTGWCILSVVSYHQLSYLTSPSDLFEMSVKGSQTFIDISGLNV